MARIALLNGPNLNLLGTREPEIYGTTDLRAIRDGCQALADTLGVELAFDQFNREGDLIEGIQREIGHSDALIINPAGLSFRSLALREALALFGGPVIELHLSNIHSRDESHRDSVQSGAATGVICGLGSYGYLMALLAAARMAGVVAADLPAPLAGGIDR